MKIRLQKILAQAGIASRRKSEELICSSRVKINDRIARIGEKADSEKDLIKVDGKPIKIEKKVYILLNKPKDYVTTTAKYYGEKNVLELVKVKQRVFPVGRLDKDAEGLVLLTNDGEIANKLMHPKYEVKKEYHINLEKKISDKNIEEIKKGIKIEERIIKCSINKLNEKELKIIIHEGRKHIVKRIFENFKHTVKKLVREKIGPLTLDLASGKWRYLKEEELSRLRNLFK